MEEEKIEFAHYYAIKDYLQQIREILNNIDLESKDLNFNNIKEMKKQKEKLKEIENIGHLICNYSAIKIVSPEGQELL